jgi:uncharacterized protein (DUF433 family)
MKRACGAAITDEAEAKVHEWRFFMFSGSVLSSRQATHDFYVRIEQVIFSDREVQGGTVVFAGTRVPVKNLFDYLAAGDSLEEFLDDFPSVTREQAVAALELAHQAVMGGR